MSAEPFSALLLYQLSMSLLSVGGVITLAAEQHRHMVVEQGWLSDAQFQASITLAQAAPGPNVLFLALWGWHVGLNAAGPSGPPWLAAALGLVLCLVGALGPSSVLAIWANRWSRRHSQRNIVQALRQGLAPVVVGATAATAVVLLKATVASMPMPASADPSATSALTGLPGLSWLPGLPGLQWLPWLMAAAAAVAVWRTRVHLLVLLALGGGIGLACGAWLP